MKMDNQVSLHRPGTTDIQHVELNIINSLDELIAFIQKYPRTLYVRHSCNIQGDLRRGYSLNHANGSEESGLSFLTLSKSDENETAESYKCRIARQIQLYHSASDNAEVAWIACEHPDNIEWYGRGWSIGRGSDGEPTLSSPLPVAILQIDVLRQARKIVHGEKVSA